MDDIKLKRIQKMIRNKFLSEKELFFILSTKIECNGKLINIQLFNQWIRNYYNYFGQLHKTISFNNIEFRNLDLTSVDFRNVQFIKCSFNSCNLTYSDFLKAKFSDVHFWGINIESACFRGANFTNTIFDDVEPNGEVNFLETKFTNCRISFIKLENSHLDFTNSIFQNTIFTIPTGNKDGNFHIINPLGLGDGKILDNGGIMTFRIDYCHFENCRLVNLKISFFYAQFSVFNNCDFINTNITYTLNIKGANINNVRINNNFFQIFYEKATIDEYEECLSIYNNYKNLGNSFYANKYYLLSRKLLTTKYFATWKLNKWKKKKILVKYLFNKLNRLLWNYGESPLLIIVWSLVVIIAIAVFISCCNLSEAKNFWDSLYLSAITFATVGYGDLKPVETGKILLSIEGFLGPFLISLFVVSLAKKMIE